MEHWLAYAVVVTVVVCSPGPMTIFAMANGLAHGQRIAITGILGGSVAYMGHLAIVYSSLATISHLEPGVLRGIRVLGGLYFLWLACKNLRSRSFMATQAPGRANATTPLRTWLRGFFIAASNPKALLFFAALFPQFIRPAQDFTAQFLPLAAIYLVLQFLANLGYSLFGGRLLHALSRARAEHLAPRIVGVILGVIGLLMLW